MSIPDIRKGDLVKATNRQHPEETVQGRVQVVNSGYLDTLTKTFARDRWDFEVLDRPLPPIDEELLTGAITAWRHGHGFSTPTEGYQVDNYRASLTAVINYLRQNDPILKENA